MRKLAVFALSFSAAVFLAQYLLPEGWLIPAALVCLPLGFIGLVFKSGWRLRIILASVGLTAGFFWCVGYAALFYTPAKALDGQITLVTAEVLSYPQETAYGEKAEVRLLLGDGKKVKALLYFDYGDYIPGDILSLNARLRLTDKSYNLADDNFILVYPKGEISLNRPDNIPIKHYPALAAAAVSEKINQIFTSDIAPFMEGLIMGDTDSLSDDFLTASGRSGLRHVVAVSGMNLSFLLGIIGVLAGKRRRLSAFIGIPLVLVFMAVMGATPSVLRAGIMYLLALAAQLTKREADSGTSLTFSLMLILIHNPFSAKSAGLQLSFSAMLGIIYLTPKIYNYFLQHGAYKAFTASRGSGAPAKLLTKAKTVSADFIAASIASSLGAMVFTVPITAICFGYLSLIAPLSNLMALWSVSWAFSIGFIAVIISFISSGLGSVIAFLVWPLAKYSMWIIRLSAFMPFAAVYTQSKYISAWLIYVYAVLSACTFLSRGRPRKKLIIPAASCVAALCLAVIISYFSGLSAAMTVTALDVGQGQCVVIMSGGSVTVMDCGGYDSGNIAADYISSLSRDTVDLLVLSHYHSDHISGVETLMRRLRVKLLAIPDIEDSNREALVSLADELGVKVAVIGSDTKLKLGGAEINLYAPEGSKSDNENCMAALYSAGDYDALLLGDMAMPAERRFLENAQLPDIEVLMVPHHGSKYSCSDELITATKPETALISVGENNSYGQPADETLKRLEAADINVYRTDTQGNIKVSLGRV